MTMKSENPTCPLCGTQMRQARTPRKRRTFGPAYICPNAEADARTDSGGQHGPWIRVWEPRDLPKLEAA